MPVVNIIRLKTMFCGPEPAKKQFFFQTMAIAWLVSHQLIFNIIGEYMNWTIHGHNGYPQVSKNEPQML